MTGTSVTGGAVLTLERSSSFVLAATNPGSLTLVLLGPSRSEMQVVESGQLQIFRTGSNMRVPEKTQVHSYWQDHTPDYLDMTADWGLRYCIYNIS